MTFRPRRSVLYMPAANARALEKARTIPADALIFDLEDAVAPDAKAQAREQAAAAAAEPGAYGRRELTIRCNGADTPWGADDLRAAAAAGPDGVVIPKVERPEQVAAAARALEAGGAPDRTALWVMCETPAAILAAREIAAVDRVAVMVMGTNDLAKELRARLVPGRAPLLPALCAALLAARAAGIDILDGVYNNVRDLDGFTAECRQAAELGFDGKTLIHPTQVEPCNAVWAPTEDEVTAAQAVIAAFAEAERDGRGVVVVDGRMVENLHVENARRTLAVAEAVAALA